MERRHVPFRVTSTVISSSKTCTPQPRQLFVSRVSDSYIFVSRFDPFVWFRDSSFCRNSFSVPSGTGLSISRWLALFSFENWVASGWLFCSLVYVRSCHVHTSNRSINNDKHIRNLFALSYFDRLDWHTTDHDTVMVAGSLPSSNRDNGQ